MRLCHVHHGLGGATLRETHDGMVNRTSAAFFTIGQRFVHPLITDDCLVRLYLAILEDQSFALEISNQSSSQA